MQFQLEYHLKQKLLSNSSDAHNNKISCIKKFILSNHFQLNIKSFYFISIIGSKFESTIPSLYNDPSLLYASFFCSLRILKSFIWVFKTIYLNLISILAIFPWHYLQYHCISFSWFCLQGRWSFPFHLYL